MLVFMYLDFSLIIRHNPPHFSYIVAAWAEILCSQNIQIVASLFLVVF